MVTNNGAEPPVLERNSKTGKDKNNTSPRRSKRLMKVAPAHAFVMMTLASTNAMHQPHNRHEDSPEEFFDAISEPPDTLHYFDAEEHIKPGRVMHLSIYYQILGEGIKGEQSRVCFTSSENVDAFLSDLDYKQMTGNSEVFDTVACALTTVEKIQRLESLQPKLAWKPLDVIEKTLENTTQYARIIANYPMKSHHVARFP